MSKTQPFDSAAIRIALLEDDDVIAELIGITLQEAGWNYQCFTSIDDISKALEDQSFDLYILDWSLPDGEVDVVIKLLRDIHHINSPILVESVNGDEEQIVTALALGADDYVVKPLRMSELKARISALLRRDKQVLQSNFSHGGYQINEANHDVSLDGEYFHLSALEYKLALYFFQHVNVLLSRDQLLADVWQRNNQVDTRTVDAHVSRLRKKLGFSPETGFQLVTLRGYGYRLEAI